MRLLSVLLVAMLVTGALAGCFHKDEKKNGDDGNGVGDGNGNGDGDGDGDGNITVPPVVDVPPVASIKIFDADDNETNVTAVHGEANKNITMKLNASNSTDADGNITIYAWSVTGPRDFEFENQNVTAEFEIADSNGYGAYLVRLTVIDDDNLIGTANTTLYVNYDITRQVTLGTRVGTTATGPAVGQGERPEPNDGSCTDTACHVHTVSTLGNATGATFTVTWAASEIVSPSGGMAMWVLDPSDTVLTTVPSGSSPREAILSASQLEASGQYKVEAHIDGASDSNGLTYTFHAVVRYGPS